MVTGGCWLDSAITSGWAGWHAVFPGSTVLLDGFHDGQGYELYFTIAGGHMGPQAVSQPNGATG